MTLLKLHLFYINVYACLAWGIFKLKPFAYHNVRHELTSIFSTKRSGGKSDNRVAQSIVSSLTSLANIIFHSDTEISSIDKNLFYKNQYVKPDTVFNGILNDFYSGYLFSGSIDKEIYNLNCVFTDPTLSFKGLTTFIKNVASVKPLADYFLGETIVVLYDLKLLPNTIDHEFPQSSGGVIEAFWRMSGEVKRLPWSPRIELQGKTRYTYLPISTSHDTTTFTSTTVTISNDMDGRIIDYYETWQLPALDVLKQLLKPTPLKYNYKEFMNQTTVQNIAVSNQTSSTICLDMNVIKNYLLNVDNIYIDNSVIIVENIKKLNFVNKLGLLPDFLSTVSHSTNSSFLYQIIFKEGSVSDISLVQDHTMSCNINKLAELNFIKPSASGYDNSHDEEGSMISNNTILYSDKDISLLQEYDSVDENDYCISIFKHY